MITIRGCWSTLLTVRVPSLAPWTSIGGWLATAAACTCMSSLVAAPVMAQRPPEAIPEPAPVSNACLLRVSVLQGAVLSAAASRAMQDEVERIWQPHGVTFHWRTMGPADSVPPDTLVLSVRSGRRESPSSPVAGVVVFATPVRPGTFIRLQIATGSVLESARVGGKSLSQWPPVVRDTYVGLALGRVLAHEVGHYVLATRQHTETGLMRPALSANEVVGPHGDGFRLSPASEALLSPTWLGRSTCDHLTTAVAAPSVVARR